MIHNMKIVARVWILGALFSQLMEYGKAQEPEDKFTQCLDGWYQFRNKCFKLFGQSPKDWITWESAREVCFEYGGTLVSMHSKEEHAFVVTYLLLPVAHTMWIGLNSHAVDRKFEWDDNTLVNFTKWDDNEPTFENKGEKEPCVQMVFKENSPKFGRWNDNACIHRLPYGCQMPAGTEQSGINPKYCSDSRGGGYSFQQSCYHTVNLPKTWTDAEIYCQSTYGGHLAAITDELVQKYLSYVLREAGVTSTVWLGLKAPQTDRLTLWVSGWHLAYTNWANSAQQLREDTCLSFLRSGQWEMRSCKRTLSFICEVSDAKAPVLSPSIEGSYCPVKSDEWKDLGGDYCYYFTGDFENWHHANFQCYRRGGTLASIHSRAELESLAQFVRYKAFSILIGLYRKYDGSFAWVDESDFDYHNWDDNQPSGEPELCVEIIAYGNYLRWNDLNCDIGFPYICSMRKIAPNSTVRDEIYCPGQLYTVT